METLQKTKSTTEDEVETRTSEIDVDAIMATIRRTIQSRWAKDLHQATYFPEFEEFTCPEEPANDEHNPLLYFLLRELNQTYAPRFQVEPELAPLRLNKLPIVGSLWNSVRGHLHRLSIFYVNKIAGKMTGYNRYVITILNLITSQDQKRETEVAELKQRLAKLEAQLACLEQEG